MRVIDSSVLVKYFSREEGWERARKYVVEGAITLDLAVKELSNALWKKVLRNEIDPELAIEIIEDIIREKPLIIEEETKYLVEALQYSIKYKITIYDALFIVLAKNKNLELVTADKKQAEVAEETGIKTVLV